MSRYCRHNMVWGRCPCCDEAAPPHLNLDRHGMPKDFRSYMWVTYGQVIPDETPAMRSASAVGAPRPPSRGSTTRVVRR